MDEQIRQQLREIGIEVDDEGTFESNESRRAAISISLRLIGFPMGIVFLYWGVEIATVFHTQPGTVLALLACSGMAVMAMTFFVVFIVGWLAHRICWRSSIPVCRMTIAMAFTFDVVMIWWTFILLVGGHH